MEGLRLPASVLLQVVQSSDVTTIQHFRLASKALYDLINTYQTSVCDSILKQHCEELDIHRYGPLCCSKPSIRLLLQVHNRIQITKWLAGVAVEHHDDGHPDRRSPTHSQNISSQDPRGDAIRARVQIGWSVLWRLADIARMVKTDENPNKVVEDSHVARSIDESIHQARMKFLEDLPFEERTDYLIMKLYLNPAFYELDLDDREFFKPGDEEDPGDYEDELNIIGKHWLAWIYLEKGPLFIQKAWSGVDGNKSCFRIISEQWHTRTHEQLRFRHRAAEELSMVLRSGDEDEELDDAGTLFRALTDFEDDPRLPVDVFRDIPYRIRPN